MADISKVKNPDGNTYNVKDSTARDHIANKNNPHAVTKAQIGLGNVDNTSDAEKHVLANNINWGGNSIVDDVSPIDAAMSNAFSGNVIDFANPAGITIEYSTDGGGSWNDYGADDQSKIALVTCGNSTEAHYYLGKNSTAQTAGKDLLRITLNGPSMCIYCQPKNLLIYYSKNGATGNYVTIDYAYRDTPSTFVNYGKYNVEGWSGWNSIPINRLGIFGTNGKDHQPVNLRLTFGFTDYLNGWDSNTNACAIKILMTAVSRWSVNSNSARNNHLYTYDTSQNAFFPAQVTATKFNGSATNADSATKATQDASGNVITSTYATKNELTSHSQNVSNPHKVTAAQVGALPLSGGTLTGNLTAPSFNGKVNGYTISANVPAGAKFTDTTYSNATASTSGLMSSADKTKLDGIAAGAEFIDAIKACPPAISHRMIYRGKNLGTSFTTEQSKAVQNGTFTDIYVGDYWVINGKTRRIGDIDYFYGCGDTSLDQHHLLIVDDGVDLAGDGSTTHFMNDTDTTAGGFKGSKMWQSTIPNKILPDITTAFGSHLLTHREYISNAVTDGVPSNGEWVDTTYNLFNEVMYYGSVVNGANIGGAGIFNIGCSKNQIALFKLDQSSMNRRNSIWLRDVVSATAFALAYSFGYATGGFTSFPWFSVLGYYLIH